MYTLNFVIWMSVFVASVFMSLGFVTGGVMASAKRADEDMDRERDYLAHQQWEQENTKPAAA